jgi:SAM-dependent methyltransferase
MDVDDLVRDTLPANQPYAGVLAEAYDVWLPPDRNYDDVDTYRHAIEHGGGSALELGCGNGRLLLNYLRDGLHVEGVDASVDMLAICAQHARDARLDVTLHHTDWTTLDLKTRFATIYNPAGSFMLIEDDDRARAALATWQRHLRPGGKLWVSMGVPTGADLEKNYEWRIRRSGTRARDGMTFIAHEAFRYDTRAQLQRILNRHEVWDPDGSLVTTYMRRIALRWWTGPQMEQLLGDCGYVDVRLRGSNEAFLATGRAP